MLTIYNPFEDRNKMLLLYFLKTGDYKYIKVYLKDDDIRLFENSHGLLRNEEVSQVISNWNFQKIDIIIDEETQTSIKL